MSTDPSDIEGATRELVERYTQDRWLFTALDVSNEVKRIMGGVRHRDVASLVRVLFDDGAMGADYVRTLIDVVTGSGGNAQAYLYHHRDDDPADYGTDQRALRALAPRPADDDAHEW